MSFFSFFTLSDKGLEENIVRSTIQELVLKRDTTHKKKKNVGCHYTEVINSCHKLMYCASVFLARSRNSPYLGPVYIDYSKIFVKRLVDV